MTSAQQQVLARWRAACERKSGNPHQYWDGGSARRRWLEPIWVGADDRSDKPYVVGKVERWRPRSGEWLRSGSYRIEYDGTVTRAPDWLRKAAAGQLRWQMKFKMEITLGNEAMQTGLDVATALQKVGSHIREYNEKDLPGAEGNIRDINGNTVGKWKVDDEGGV